MLCAQEHSLFATWTEHHIVAEFINEHHVKIMMFCDIVVNEENKTTLQKRCCELHNLDVFPAPSNPAPPPPAAPPADQDGPMHIRGGGGEDDLGSSDLHGLGLSEEEGYPHVYAGTSFQVDGSPEKDSQQVGADVPPLTQRSADSPEKQLSQGEQPNDADAAAAAGGLGVGQAAASNNHTPAASGQQRPAVTPAPPSILRRTGEDGTANLAFRFAGAGETTDHVMQGNEVGDERGEPNPYANVQQPTDGVASLRPTVDKIKHLLDGIYEQVFVKPRETYLQTAGTFE